MFLRLLYLLPLAIFAAVVVHFADGLTRDPAILPSTLIGKPLPAFSLPPLNPGQPGLASDDLGGQVAIINVFASWCVPCQAEHPLWIALAKTGAVPVYGINWKDRREDAVAWLEKLGNPYARIGFDPDNEAGVALGIYGVPETYIIDREGRVHHRHPGPVFEEDFLKTIGPMLRELRQ